MHEDEAHQQSDDVTVTLTLYDAHGTLIGDVPVTSKVCTINDLRAQCFERFGVEAELFADYARQRELSNFQQVLHEREITVFERFYADRGAEHAPASGAATAPDAATAVVVDDDKVSVWRTVVSNGSHISDQHASYLRTSTRGRRSVYAPTVNIGLFGDSMTGKTALQKKYFDDSFAPEYEKSLPVHRAKHELIGNTFYQVQVCDTSGGFEYQHLKALWVEGKDIYVIVLSLHDRESIQYATQTGDEVQRHLHECARTDALIALVGTKLDVPGRTISRPEFVEIAKQIRADAHFEVAVPQEDMQKFIYSLVSQYLANQQQCAQGTAARRAEETHATTDGALARPNVSLASSFQSHYMNNYVDGGRFSSKIATITANKTAEKKKKDARGSAAASQYHCRGEVCGQDMCAIW